MSPILCNFEGRGPLSSGTLDYECREPLSSILFNSEGRGPLSSGIVGTLIVRAGCPLWLRSLGALSRTSIVRAGDPENPSFD